jgi:hypothetical protein
MHVLPAPEAVATEGMAAGENGVIGGGEADAAVARAGFGVKPPRKLTESDSMARWGQKSMTIVQSGGER